MVHLTAGVVDTAVGTAEGEGSGRVVHIVAVRRTVPAVQQLAGSVCLPEVAADVASGFPVSIVPGCLVAAGDLRLAGKWFLESKDFGASGQVLELGPEQRLGQRPVEAKIEPTAAGFVGDAPHFPAVGLQLSFAASATSPATAEPVAALP